ncbi:phage holin family protein [Yersinia intermedia]|uniref:phage holin family protein n=1 Tax=Yersinia intermedia TaxID=631 RepID=UPI0022FEE567|nr:phage holin family protein [Yersinia intermedia]MDA5480858.1 phage holin family protein [Yersinia intermedia]
MADPVTATATVGSTLTGVAIATFFAGLPADVVLGAFAGAILFVVSASDYGIRSRLVLTVGSFGAGLTMYKPAAAWIVDFLPENYDRGADAAGALIAAACVIRLLMMINSGGFLKRKGGNNDNS